MDAYGSYTSILDAFSKMSNYFFKLLCQQINTSGAATHTFDSPEGEKCS
jgi:hypothetical protein